MRWPWQRKPPDPLGEGVWRRAHDRFRRAVDRFHQVIEPVPDGVARGELERTGAKLAAALDAVHRVCVQAQLGAPSSGDDVPGGGWTAVHRCLTRAGTTAAQAAEGAVLARVAVLAGDVEAADQACAAARRAADRVGELVREAAERAPATG